MPSQGAIEVLHDELAVGRSVGERVVAADQELRVRQDLSGDAKEIP